MKTIQKMFDLSGKVAVVTGGSMGIGYGIAERLAEAGASVVITDIAQAEGRAKAAALHQRGYEAEFIKVDVSSEKDVKNMVTDVVRRHGKIDILVNNAGIYPSQSVLTMGTDLWDKVQAVNGRGVFLMTREVGNVMAKKRRGSIINIASIDSLHPSMVGLAAYDTSKHGVWGFTKNTALELGKYKIRVNAIAPGGIATEGVANMNQGKTMPKTLIKKFMEKIPMGRFGMPDEIALPTLFLASDASSYMTGSIMVVDGGVLLS